MLNVTRNRSLAFNGPASLVRMSMARLKNMVLSLRSVCIKYQLTLTMSSPPFTTLPVPYLKVICCSTCLRQSSIAGLADCPHFSSSLGAVAHWVREARCMPVWLVELQRIRSEWLLVEEIGTKLIGEHSLLKKELAPINAAKWDRIIPCHGEVIETDGKVQWNKVWGKFS